MSNSLRLHGLYSPWNSPDQNTGAGSHSLLQGIFPNQGSNPGLPHCRQVLYQLSHQRSLFVSLGRFIPRYHGLFVVMANGIVSLTSLSDSSLLVCRNARDFSVLILYFITLFNSLISYSNFLTASLEGFSTYSIQRRQWQPTPVHLPGKSHEWRSLVGCSPRGH